MSRLWGGLLLAAWIGAIPRTAGAIDFSVSGFGTVGYARSNQPYAYQRVIDDNGTFARDTVAGLQLDARHEQFGGTVQFKLAPASDSDDDYTGTVSWAFLSWRPTNDWLFRAGKQRIPLYLYSQTVDVGVTYDFARLPTEMYSISPSNDFVGLSFAKTWAVDSGELVLDGYWGNSKANARFWQRDYVPAVPLLQFPGQTPGAQFEPLKLTGGGLVLSYRRNEDIYRIGASRVKLEIRDGTPVPTTYPFVMLPFPPEIGYYEVDYRRPGNTVPSRDRITTSVITLGADVRLGSGFRVIGEFARTFAPNTDISIASNRGYVSLLKNIDQWTPYVLYAFLRSSPGERNLYNNVNYHTIPDFIPGAALINASQRIGADHTFAYDQSSWAVGASYSFSATSMLKAEFLRTHVGQMSTLVDAPPGGNIRNQNINVFSLSYNLAF